MTKAMTETEQLRHLVEAREKHEDPAETAYWLFDAKRNGYPPHLHVGERSAFKDVYRAGMADLRSILSRMEKMEAALEFYGSIEQYEGISLGVSPLNKDRGQRARDALK